MTVATQEARAKGAAAATEALAREPNVVGLHWFQLYDHPKGGRADGEDYNFGLVDVRDRPYEKLVATLSRVNRLVLDTSQAKALVQPGVAFVPYAAIDAEDSSFVDWPKAVALISMQSAPDEPVFGDVYLSWDDEALNVAVIAMDYYDPHLMAWSDEFPRRGGISARPSASSRESKNISCNFDVVPDSRAGDGGRFDFHVRACQVDETPCEGPDHREVLWCCDGSAARHLRGQGSVDQFRRQAGGRGGSRPHSFGDSFYRSRWMSLSGEAPDSVMKHPSRWSSVKLGLPPAAASPLR